MAEAKTAPAYRKASKRWTEFAQAIGAARQPKMDLSDIFKRGNVLKVPRSQALRTGEIWVHGLYGTLADSMENMLGRKDRWGLSEFKNFHLIGPPGTGKTTFETVWLYYLAQTKKNKVILGFKEQETWVYFDFSLQSYPRVLLADGFNAYENLVDEDTWLIVDGPSTYIDHPGPILHCVSDTESSHHEFAKQGPGMYLYMESWTLQDCVDCANALELDINDMASRYYYCGGVPRLIFSQGPAALKRIIDSSLENLGDVENMVKNRGVESDELFHYKYPADFLVASSSNIPNARRLVPVSQYVLLKLAQLLKLDTDRKWGRWLKESEAAGVRGLWFEECAHKRIEKGGKFRMKELKKLGAAEQEVEIRPSWIYTVDYEWELYSSATTSLLNIEAQQKWPWSILQSNNTYVRAVVKNHKSWDGFYVGAAASTARLVVRIFLITVSVDHPIKWDAIEELMTRIDAWAVNNKYQVEYEMVFVVPCDVYGSFPEQDFLEKEGRHVYKRVPAATKTFKQYALEIVLS